MTDRDPPEDYIGLGFRIDPSGNSPVEETVKLEIEPGGFEVEAWEEPAESVVAVRFEDSGRSSGADLLMDGSRAREMIDRVSTALEEVSQSDD